MPESWSEYRRVQRAKLDTDTQLVRDMMRVFDRGWCPAAVAAYALRRCSPREREMLLFAIDDLVV